MNPADVKVMYAIWKGTTRRQPWVVVDKPNRNQLKRLMDSDFLDVRTTTYSPWYSPTQQGHRMTMAGGAAAYAAVLRRDRQTRVVVEARLTPTGREALTSQLVYKKTTHGRAVLAIKGDEV